MRSGSKKESLLGIVLTALLCLGFLWWWFRPQAQTQSWQDQSAVQLVERAMKETRPTGRVEQQVLDLDLMEIALGLVSGRRPDEALAVAGHILDPALRFIAAQQLARVWINADSQDYGAALGFTALVSDPQRHAEIRADIFGLIAWEFPDIALEEAKTPLLKALLATRMKGTDQKPRELIAEATFALPALPAAEAAAVRLQIARAQVRLSGESDPSLAIAAIKALPTEQRGELWPELIGWCQGRADKSVTVPLVYQQVEDPALRRRLEIESLLFDIKLRPRAEILAGCQADVDRAASPADKVRALLVLADARANMRDDLAQEAAAVESLRSAHSIAKTVTNPAERCRLLLGLARELSLVLAFDASKSALDEAIAAAPLAPDAAERAALLLAAGDECSKQADDPRAAQLTEQAATSLAMAPASAPEVIQQLATAIMRRGDWLRAFTLLDGIPGEAARQAALNAVVTTAVEDFRSVDPAKPPPRGEPIDTIWREAITDQVRAANLSEAQPGGFLRARAWLAMARATYAAPMSLTGYQADGPQPPEDLPPDGDDTESPPPPGGEESR